MTEETREGAPLTVGFRDEARRLLRTSYERQMQIWGRVVQVDLGAGAEELGIDDWRSDALADFMETVGWLEPDPYSRDASGSARRITPRGLVVLREDG